MNIRTKKKIHKRGGIFKYKNYKSIKRLFSRVLNTPPRIYTLNGCKDWEDMGKKFEDLFCKGEYER